MKVIGAGVLVVAGAVGLVALAARSGSPVERAPTAATSTELRVETVASGLDTPWDMLWGPDGRIWASERGGRIVRIDPASGRVDVAGTVDVAERGEGGLMGMALHPDFAMTPWVYAAHSYTSLGRVRNRLIRMRWADGRLGQPEVLFDNMDGAGNHNGSRLAIGPDRMLYVTMGDAGDASVAQDRAKPNGKILRFTLEGRPAPDNPFGTAVWSWGHRNPQGLAFQPETGVLYETEHGPGDADEVNRIEKGRNYGWPDVHGACDNARETDFCREHNVAEPLAEWTPTIAPSGAAFYDADLIPGWRGSLLFTALGGARLVRLTLSEDGRRVTAQEQLFRGEYGRLRDVLVGPDGSVYLATSNRDGRGRPAREDDRVLRVRP
jgi:glucose/arabinose dehydrogenase